jgi:hypothetical protein
MCRSHQNCASRRDWHGHGSQAAQPAATQLILVLPWLSVLPPAGTSPRGGASGNRHLIPTGHQKHRRALAGVARDDLYHGKGLIADKPSH